MIWKQLLEKGLSIKKKDSQKICLFFHSQSCCFSKVGAVQKIEIFLLSQVFLFFIQNGFLITFFESNFYLSHACLIVQRIT